MPGATGWSVRAAGAVLLAVAAVGCGTNVESDTSEADSALNARGATGSHSKPSEATDSVPAPSSGEAHPYGKSDGERMDDVHAIVRAIEEYRRRTGRLPFDETFASAPDEGVGLSINVNLSAWPLRDEFRQPPAGMTGSILSAAEFIEYLRKVMGPEFTLPTDPAPAPRFYQIHFTAGEYYVSAALFEPNEHTMPMADDWHKYQIGSRPDPATKVRAVDQIERP